MSNTKKLSPRALVDQIRALTAKLAVLNKRVKALEADMCSERTSTAPGARKARGLRLGAAPLAETNPGVVRQIQELYATGQFTHVSLAVEANRLGLPTKRGKRWHASQVARTLIQKLKEEPVAQ